MLAHCFVRLMRITIKQKHNWYTDKEKIINIQYIYIYMYIYRIGHTLAAFMGMFRGGIVNLYKITTL